MGWQGNKCDTCVPYPGCLNGHCEKSWECHCDAGWTGPKCDIIETEQFGLGIRDGRCNKEESFLCMNGGVDVCSWSGDGTVIDYPRCKCKPGFSGKFCQDSLSRDVETVFSQLPGVKLLKTNITTTTPTSTTEFSDLQEDLFPAKLDNALEKL